MSDPASPLTGMRSFNRLSGPDANACSGCHDGPFGIAGGSGDFVGNVFVLGQRFDFVTLDEKDLIPGRGRYRSREAAIICRRCVEFPSTPGMFGACYLEMLARRMTADLRAIRAPVARTEPRRCGRRVCFGELSRRADGAWDVSKVEVLGR
ncbi:MAG: hypothetical protein IPJ98_26240 [Bryobacterales bacterium]|nr:hypothetical protein [Bryobacterales bacterium]